MKITITFIPSEYTARYSYKSRNLAGTIVRMGCQFDPFEEFRS